MHSLLLQNPARGMLEAQTSPRHHREWWSWTVYWYLYPLPIDLLV